MSIGSNARRLAYVAALLLLPAIVHGEEAAQGYITLKNKYQNGFLQAAGTTLSQGTNAGAPNTHWVMVPNGPQNPKAFRLRSTDGKFLHLDHGTLEVADVKPNWEGGSALWTMESVDSADMHLKNVAKADAYLNNETGKLAAGPIQPGWQSAIWTVQVTLTIDNMSAAPLDVFVEDDSGTPALVTTIPANNRLIQLTPPGAIWRIAQNDKWMGEMTSTTNPYQRVRFPTGSVGTAAGENQQQPQQKNGLYAPHGDPRFGMEPGGAKPSQYGAVPQPPKPVGATPSQNESSRAQSQYEPIPNRK